MGVFDKDLIQKDLSVKDILREKIISIASNITHHINEATTCGASEFSRITEPGSYGSHDTDIVWKDRYEAFNDYLTIAVGKLQEELNRHPIINDKKTVLIDGMSVFGDIWGGSRWNKDSCVLYKVNIEYTLCSGVIPFVRSERFMTTISFDVSLDSPHPLQEPWNLHSSYPYPVVW